MAALCRFLWTWDQTFGLWCAWIFKIFWVNMRQSQTSKCSFIFGLFKYARLSILELSILRTCSSRPTACTRICSWRSPRIRTGSPSMPGFNILPSPMMLSSLVQRKLRSKLRPVRCSRKINRSRQTQVDNRSWRNLRRLSRDDLELPQRSRGRDSRKSQEKCWLMLQRSSLKINKPVRNKMLTYPTRLQLAPTHQRHRQK